MRHMIYVTSINITNIVNMHTVYNTEAFNVTISIKQRSKARKRSCAHYFIRYYIFFVYISMTQMFDIFITTRAQVQ